MAWVGDIVHDKLQSLRHHDSMSLRRHSIDLTAQLSYRSKFTKIPFRLCCERRAAFCYASQLKEIQAQGCHYKNEK